MSYTNVYPSRINWENEPSIASPINATNLNKIDYAAYQFDQTFATWDVTKANQSDLLLSVKSIDYNTSTGVFVFTWQNGTTKTVDLNIEKIPVSFSMSPQGVITMTTDDGTTYTADVGSLIKTYTFSDSTEIDFTVTTDASGNKTVTAALKDGSIVGTKLEPNYLANCQNAANSANASKTAAEGSSEDSEAWAVGTRDGVPVPSSDPAYENNSKYWAQHTSASLAGLTDTDITSPTNGQVLTYDGSKWTNDDPSAGGGSTIIVGTNEVTLRGQTCTITDGVTTLTETINNSGVATFKGVTLTGTLTITATDGVDTAQRTIDVPYFGNYTATLSFFSATITVTYPASGTCTISDGSTTLTATSNPMAFIIPNTGTWTAKATVDGIEKSGTPISITTDGQTASDTIVFGTINLTYDAAFSGSVITCVNGGTTISKTAPSGTTMVFYPPTTGEWDISGTYSGVAYTTSATVSSLSTPVSAQLRTTVNATVTLHGAAGAIISYTDETGSQTQTLDTGGSKTGVTIKANPNFPVVVFEDTTVGKKPCDLSANFKKSVVIKPSLTDIYVMPDNSLYWYGYEDDDLEDCTSANGWSGITLNAPTHNTTDIVMTTPSSGMSAVGKKTNTPSGTTIKGIASCSIRYRIYKAPSKVIDTSAIYESDVTSNSLKVYTTTETLSNFCVGIDGPSGRTVDLSALYYNTDSQYNFFSAADDVVTFKDSNNNDVVFAITDENGGAYVDYSAIPSGSYTLYSSVAKNPDSLSDAYSKQVSISSGTTSVYFMPNDNVLYWYGYESDNLEDMSSANGWTDGTFNAPTHTTQYIDLLSSSNGFAGVGGKNAVSPTTVKWIAQGIQIRGDAYGYLAVTPTKRAFDASSEYTTVSSTSLALYTHNGGSNVYLSASGITSGGTAESKLYAFWYE